MPSLTEALTALKTTAADALALLDLKRAGVSKTEEGLEQIVAILEGRIALDRAEIAALEKLIGPSAEALAQAEAPAMLPVVDAEALTDESHDLSAEARRA